VLLGHFGRRLSFHLPAKKRNFHAAPFIQADIQIIGLVRFSVYLPGLKGFLCVASLSNWQACWPMQAMWPHAQFPLLEKVRGKPRANA
jgi:hypothetical protein